MLIFSKQFFKADFNSSLIIVSLNWARIARDASAVTDSSDTKADMRNSKSLVRLQKSVQEFQSLMMQLCN